MKRLVLAFIFLLTVLIGSVCHASDLSNNQFALGGIDLNSTMNYAKSMYGTPSKTYTADAYGRHLTIYTYGNTLTIIGTGGRVYSVASTGRNLSTPAGVAVGMPANILNTVYGKADKVFPYYDDTVYEYKNHGDWALLFHVKNFYITKITCAVNVPDPQHPNDEISNVSPTICHKIS